MATLRRDAAPAERVERRGPATGESWRDVVGAVDFVVAFGLDCAADMVAMDSQLPYRRVFELDESRRWRLVAGVASLEAAVDAVDRWLFEFDAAREGSDARGWAWWLALDVEVPV